MECLVRIAAHLGWMLCGIGVPTMFIGVVLSAEAGVLVCDEVDWFMVAGLIGMGMFVVGVVLVLWGPDLEDPELEVRKMRSRAAKDIATLRRECMRLDVELYRRNGRRSLLDGVRRVKREFPLPQSLR